MARASERDVQQVGREIFTRMRGQTPSVFQKDWWSGKMMDLSMTDEAFKVEMFRFVDVFPSLRDPIQIAEHLQEYFCRPEQNFPASFQWGLGRVKPEGRIARMAAGQIEKQIVGMAQKFIPGSTAEEALPVLRQMWDEGLAFTLDLLGEAAVSEAESAVYLERYEEILNTLIAQTASFPNKPVLQRAPYGEVPRVNVSIKVSSLYSQLDPLDFDGSIEAVKARLRPLFRLAKAHNAFINLDMEQYRYKDLYLALFKSLLSEPEFADFPHAGIVIQAYLRDAVEDVEALCKWAKRRKTPVTVRLVKGAYWDYETIHSVQEGWDCPVFGAKWETDASFERCAELLIDHHKHIRTAIGSHNVRSMAHAMVYARAKRLEKTAIEFQMLFGMAEPMKAAVRDMGYRVRDYVPIGAMIPGMAYLVRRLLENTSNESWLRASFADGESLDVLLAKPDGRPSPRRVAVSPKHQLHNEPLRDFAHAEVRDRFARAVQTVRGRLGGEVSPVVGGQPVQTRQHLPSVDPSHTDTIVGRVGMADDALAARAVERARAAQPAWAARPATERAGIIRKVAALMQERRDELAAWMVFEVGKNWREADADVCEAIDFCNYYAQEMERLSHPQRQGHLPGELSLMFYRPRGVCAVIAPWNFPLAILCGMAVAALVTGNTVLLKPAEQSSVIAARFMELLQRAGVPADVAHFLPGPGESVGRHLVQSPHVQVIAFTGSMEVGLEILREAGNTRPGQPAVKKVVCEMGGKNAIIVDADADLDEAVQGVLRSAFGFQGQKCSACSRVIVHTSCIDAFRERLVEAARSLMQGPAWDPAYYMGPVVDAQARDKILGYIELGQREGRLLFHGEAPAGGTYVAPAIFDRIAPDARLAQEEIFGPVLAIIEASSFDEALQIANSTPFALTGGVYSRSPYNIEAARTRFAVGNLYINRGCTGAIVNRHPFGGFGMSGVGSKAGGPDYLLQFMEPRVVTENTMRRGFAPDT